MKKYLMIAVLALFAMALFSVAANAGERLTIVGTVTDNYEVVTDDDKVYGIGESEKGDELLGFIDQKVKVTGMVEEIDGEKVINVISYEVLED